MSASTPKLHIQIAADVGGTFTDVVVALSDGFAIARKVLSTPPEFEHADF